MTLLDTSVSDRWPSGESIVDALREALSHSSEQTRRLISTLSIAVSVAPQELLEVHNAVWGDELTLADVSVVTDSPLVENVRGLVRLSAPLDTALAAEMRLSDRQRFETLHARFADLEAQRHEATPSDYDAWQIAARIAYYVAATSADESAERFIRAFDEAPHASRRECRIWLSDLVSRYEAITGEMSRVTAFFRAFRLYVSGDRESAVPLLESLISANSADGVQAIALHLLALSLDDREDGGTRSLELLQRSVDLSAALKLNENLLMSRHSLVWRNVTLARRRRPQGSVSDAARLAALNDELADRLGLAHFQTTTRNAHGVTQWLDAVGLGTPIDALAHLDVLQSSLSLLSDARDFAESCHDLYSWLVAAIGEASIHRAAGRFSDALESLEAAVIAAERSRAVGELPVRQFQAEVERLADEHDGSLDADVLEGLVRRLRRPTRRK